MKPVQQKKPESRSVRVLDRGGGIEFRAKISRKRMVSHRFMGADWKPCLKGKCGLGRKQSGL